MGTAFVMAITPSTGTLVESSYHEPEYRDAFKICNDNNLTVEQFATSFFMSQPGWFTRVSMNLGGERARREAIGSADYPTGSSIGSWKVHERSDNEIVFGEHMGFMEYRFSMLRRPDGDIEASTVVKYRKRFAPFYFTVVKPFHRGFNKVALGNAAKAAASATPDADLAQ